MQKMRESIIGEVKLQISKSFDDIPYPGDKNIFIESGAHIFDVEKAVNQLKVKHWQDIPIDALINNRDRIGYLTANGFQFYIPAFLCAVIDKPAEVDVMLDNTISYLMTSRKHQRQILLSKRVSLFTDSQIGAIVAFFKDYEIIYPPARWSITNGDKQQIEHSINYWESFLKPGDTGN